MSTTIMQSLTFTIFKLSKKIAMLKFLPHTISSTLIITYSHFSCESKKYLAFNKITPHLHVIHACIKVQVCPHDSQSERIYNLKQVWGVAYTLILMHLSSFSEAVHFTCQKSSTKGKQEQPKGLGSKLLKSQTTWRNKTKQLSHIETKVHELCFPFYNNKRTISQQPSTYCQPNHSDKKKSKKKNLKVPNKAVSVLTVN